MLPIDVISSHLLKDIFQKFLAVNCPSLPKHSFFFLQILFYLFIYFLLYNIVLVLPYINMNPPQVYTCSPSRTLLPPRTIPLGRLSAPAPSILYPASNLDWQFVSYMILYMFQCHSPKSSHPHPLPESKRLFYTAVSLLLSCIQGYRYHLSIHNGVLLSH